MPRRREVPKRRIIPDPKFKDKLVAKFMNSLMVGGKKATAEGILYGAFEIIQQRYKEEPLEIFRKALEIREKLQVEFPDHPGNLEDLARMLIFCPALPFRDEAPLSSPAASRCDRARDSGTLR